MQKQTKSEICVTINTINQVKIQATNWEKILAKYKAQKQLTSKIFNALLEIRLKEDKHSPTGSPSRTIQGTRGGST